MWLILPSIRSSSCRPSCKTAQKDSDSSRAVKDQVARRERSGIDLRRGNTDREVRDGKRAHPLKCRNVARVIAGKYDPVGVHFVHQLIQGPALVGRWQHYLQHHSCSPDEQVVAVCQWGQTLQEVLSGVRLAPEMD